MGNIPAEKPTQVLRQYEIPNYQGLLEHLVALIQLGLLFDVRCYEYSGANSFPRFVVTVYVQ